MSAVSVVIPTYYRNDHLPRAIKSALEQTHPPGEVIVVDDSGGSHAAPVVSEITDDRIQYLPLDENRGSQKAREAGVDVATGDYLQFLDDDDELLPTKFERQLETLETTDHRVVYGGLKLDTGTEIPPQTDVRGEVLRDALAFATWPCCLGTMLIDAELYDEIRPIKNRGEDFRVRIECARRTTFEYVDEPVIVVGTDTDTSLGDEIWQIDGQESILRDYSALYERYPDALRVAKGQIATNRARNTRSTVYEDRLWSWRAIRDSFRAARLAPENKSKEIAIALATLGGRPALKLGEQLLS